MNQFSFKRHRFSPDIIRRSIWLKAGFTLSFRDVEEMRTEPGPYVSYETIRRWFLKFGTVIVANQRRARPRPRDRWRVEEMVVVVQGNRYRLWRAIDNEGEVLDRLVQSRRGAKAARKVMRRLLEKQGIASSRIVTNKLRFYPSALRTVGLSQRTTALCGLTTG